MTSYDECIDNLKYAVQVIILNEDKTKVLAVSRKDNHEDFGLIGGKVDSIDKSLVDAAIRETKEETGLEVYWNHLYPIFQIHKDGYMSYTYLCMEYRGEIYTNEPHIVKWADWEEIKKGSFGNYNKLVEESLISMNVLNKIST